MYCRNCGNEMNNEAVVCVKCGAPKGKGNTFCSNCGNTVGPNAEFCMNCGVSFKKPEEPKGDKSKIAAGLLGIFLGAYGIHNFYLGYTGKAVAQLLLGTVGILACGLGILASSIWGLIEGIMILCESINKDGKGLPLKE